MSEQTPSPATTGPAFEPMRGLRVLDWSEGVAGPYSCQMMADLGAEVIKVERPQGDWGRTSGPGGAGHHFRALNRGKRNICLDLAVEEGREVARKLIDSADVMVTAYRPGVTERLGIGYDEVTATNPGLVYVRISAYGQTGALAGRPGSDTILQAVSGLMSQVGDPDGDPQRVGVPLIDYLAARDTLIGVLGCLLTRGGTERVSGPVDVSLFASAATLQSHLWQTYFETGRASTRTGNRNPSLAPAGMYETLDGRHIAVAVLRDEHFAKLCAALSLDDVATDPRFATNALRLENRDELEAIIVPVFASRSFAEWSRLLVEHDVLAAPVTTIADIDADPDLRDALPVVFVGDPGDGLKSMGLPIGVGATARRRLRPAASRGEHTLEILREIGYETDRIGQLVGSGVTPVDRSNQQ